MASAAMRTSKSTDPPSGVYLTALESRLKKIWLKRTRSTKSVGHSLECVKVKRCFFSAHRGTARARTASSNSESGYGAGCSSSSPLSMREMSSTSPARLCRYFADEAICERYAPVAAGLPGSSCASAVSPTIALRGVRMSWLMRARKSDCAERSCWAVRICSRLWRRRIASARDRELSAARKSAATSRGSDAARGEAALPAPASRKRTGKGSAMARTKREDFSFRLGGVDITTTPCMENLLYTHSIAIKACKYNKKPRFPGKKRATKFDIFPPAACVSGCRKRRGALACGGGAW